MSEPMDLKTFVQTTLVQIVEALKAQSAKLLGPVKMPKSTRSLHMAITATQRTSTLT
jgi:hypothetical protein